MALKFRRGTTAQQSGSLAFGEPFVNTTLGTLLVGGPNGDIVLSAGGTGSTGNFGPISGSGLDITGNANIAGNLTLGGTITIGDAATDNLVVNADLSSSIIPDITNVFDLGSTTKIYRNVYATSISGAIAATNGVVSGSSQVIGILSSLNSFSSSQLTQNTTLATYTGSVNTRLTEIGVVSGSLITSASAAKTTNDSQGVSITNLNSATASLLIETANLETFSGSVLTRLTEIGVVSGSLITSASAAKTTNDSQGVSITNLNSATASLLIETANLETFSGSVLTRLSALEVETANLESFSGSALTRLSALEVETANLETFSSSALTRLNNLEGTDFTITLTGDVTGAGTVTNLGSVSFATTVAANSVALGTDTTGNYMTNVSAGNAGIVISHTQAEGSTATISLVSGVVSGSSQITAGSTTNFATDVKTQLNSNTVVSGSSQINVASTTGDIALGTRTSGNYVATITGGTGVSSNGATTGEGIAHTISIGQAVATSDNVRFNSLGIGMAATGTAGRIDAANDVVAFSSSDIRFKENIKPIENAIDKIRKISGNTYDWKEENKVEHGYEGNDVGVIAQEIEAVLPQLVQTRESGFKAVKYDKLVALLIEGIKEQQLQIEQLRIDLNNCRNNKGL